MPEVEELHASEWAVVVTHSAGGDRKIFLRTNPRGDPVTLDATGRDVLNNGMALANALARPFCEDYTIFAGCGLHQPGTGQGAIQLDGF